ncbi:AMP-binding protein [Azospirillum oleiclasticum]|nr:AMP-binding protein [Azospirillum oleiclasticum]
MMMGRWPSGRKLDPSSRFTVYCGVSVPRRISAVHAFGSLLEASDREPVVDVAFSDPLAISFTSGATGPSKGVLGTNAQVVTFGADWIRATDFREGDSLYTPLSLFHAIASWLGVAPTIIRGRWIAIAERFSASRDWDEVRRCNVSLAHGIFSMIPIPMKQPPRPGDADQPARTFYIGQRDPEFERLFNGRVEADGQGEQHDRGPTGRAAMAVPLAVRGGECDAKPAWPRRWFGWTLMNVPFRRPDRVRFSHHPARPHAGPSCLRPWILSLKLKTLSGT